MKTDFKVAEVKLKYRNKTPYEERQKIRNSDSAYPLFLHSYSDGMLDYREAFKVLYLDQASHVLGISTISEGGIASTNVDMRIVFQGALLTNAVAMILCHNHPSGNLTPSGDDINLTDKIVQAGKILNIRVLDHLIVSREDYYSFADSGRI